jgi:hypothetical protein
MFRGSFVWANLALFNQLTHLSPHVPLDYLL